MIVLRLRHHLSTKYYQQLGFIDSIKGGLFTLSLCIQMHIFHMTIRLSRKP